MIVDSDRKNGSGEITAESRIERERGVRGGENCIRSNHIRERHRALRNQLNREKLVVRREIAGQKRIAGVKERERMMWGREDYRADCSVKWMKRGKTKRQTAKDGTCSNQGISRYTYIFFFQFISFFLVYFVAHNSIPSSIVIATTYILFFVKNSLSVYIWQEK